MAGQGGRINGRPFRLSNTESLKFKYQKKDFKWQDTANGPISSTAKADKTKSGAKFGPASSVKSWSLPAVVGLT